MKNIQRSSEDRNLKSQKSLKSPQSDSSNEEQFVVKNLDSGSHEIVNLQQVDQVSEFKSAQTKISLWNSYFEDQVKTDMRLFKMVLNKQSALLEKTLVEQPIDLNKYTYMDGWSLLHHAVVSSTLQVAKILIYHKISVNAISKFMQRTPLHEAVLSNKQKMVELLINSNSDPNIQDKDGNTPLHYAAELSYLEIVTTILTSSMAINLQIKNHQQMSAYDCIRDVKILQLFDKAFPFFCKNQQKDNLKQKINSRFTEVNGQKIQRLAKNDFIEKFLMTKNLSYQTFQKSQCHSESVNSNESAASHKTLGSKPSNWIKKKGNKIACQSVLLMKQSILQLEDRQQSKKQSLLNYQILRFIGQGGFAEVFLARRKRSSQLFAIKRMSKARILQNNLKRYVYSERNILLKCQNPFVVEAFSMFQDPNYLYISMEYCECGDLEKLIYEKGKLPQQYAKLYAAQIGLALEEIHNKNVLFRDLKSSNVLIAKDGNIKVSDFGLAKQSLVSFSFLGSVHYLAPQMLVDTQMKQHTKSIDWYLFGVLIYQLLTGRPPFHGQKQREVLFKKIKQVKPQFPSYISEDCKIMLQKLLQKNPLKRLGSKHDFEQIKKCTWFKDINWQKLKRKQYEMPQVQPVIKPETLRKKIPIDDYGEPNDQNSQYFKEWNFIKQG